MSTPRTIRDACRQRMPLDGSDAQALEGALSQCETELQSAEAKLKAWRDAVIDQLVVTHIYSAAHDEDPRKAINDLLGWEAQLALDPQVSRGAAELVAKATSLLEDKLAVVAEALHQSDTALHDWMRVYAPEHCEQTLVIESRARISERGTIGYIAGVIHNNRLAQEQLPERAQRLQEFLKAFEEYAEECVDPPCRFQ